MPKITEAARSAKRDHFVNAARRCAATRGYHDFSIDDVCLEAGVSKGAFYVHFDSKLALLLALLDDETARFERQVAPLESATAGYADRLHRFARLMLAEAHEPANVQLRTDLWAAALVEPVIRERFVAEIDRRRRRLRGWIDAGIASGELAEVPANAFASILLALMDGLVLHAAVDPSGFRWVNIRKALEVILDSLGSHGG
ncbi:MAG: TetR/AcrR family transcriptional regulator [Candidatus Dormibacteria bacterium]